MYSLFLEFKMRKFAGLYTWNIFFMIILYCLFALFHVSNSAVHKCSLGVFFYKQVHLTNSFAIFLVIKGNENKVLSNYSFMISDDVLYGILYL